MLMIYKAVTARTVE